MTELGIFVTTVPLKKEDVVMLKTLAGSNIVFICKEHVIDVDTNEDRYVVRAILNNITPTMYKEGIVNNIFADVRMVNH